MAILNCSILVMLILCAMFAAEVPIRTRWKIRLSVDLDRPLHWRAEVSHTRYDLFAPVPRCSISDPLAVVYPCTFRIKFAFSNTRLLASSHLIYFGLGFFSV